jgi:hypothetical protein
VKAEAATLIAVLSCCLLVLGTVGNSFCVVQFMDDKVNLDVYVLALDGVGASDVDNITRVVEGVKRAANSLNGTGFWYKYREAWPPDDRLKNASVCVNVVVLREWQAYRVLIETGFEFVFVNAHGETVPIPADYTRETWVDKIANAMLTRNVTWVHMASYPFYWTWQEGANEPTQWGEAGFSRLMSRIGKGNVTCWPPTGGDTEKVLFSPQAEDFLYEYSMWPLLRASADYVLCNRPLKGSEFGERLLLPLYQPYGGVRAGAIVAFTNSDKSANHGFYVHLGTSQTFDDSASPSSRDYMRGYVSVAAGILANVARKIAESWLHKAQIAVALAKQEGRTKGLSEATNYLEEARNLYESYKYGGSIIEQAYLAKNTAELASQPSLLEKTFPLIFVAGIVAVVICANFVWKRKTNNTHKG